MNMTNENWTLRSADVRRRFDRAAATFDSADFVHRVTRDGLLSRIEPMSVDARVVVDLGAATGSAIGSLKKRFRAARIIAVDLSAQMLQKARGKRSWFSRFSVVQADARSLPFADDSVDVVFSNLLLPWIDEPAAAFGEVARVLRPDGLFAFSTLGPDSLLALRLAWQASDDGVHVNRFLDMHDIGDALVRSGLRDPVLDVDRLSVTYERASALFRDLTATGARNSLSRRRRSLTGRRRFDAMSSALFSSNGEAPLSLEFELVYGHCWGGKTLRRDSGVGIDASHIPVRRR